MSVFRFLLYHLRQAFINHPVRSLIFTLVVVSVFSRALIKFIDAPPPPAAPPPVAVSPASAPPPPPPGAKDAALRVAALVAAGHLDISPGVPKAIVLVEPKYWRSLRHRDKESLCRDLIIYFQSSNYSRETDVAWISVWDMTTHKKLALAWVKDAAGTASSGSLTIYN